MDNLEARLARLETGLELLVQRVEGLTHELKTLRESVCGEQLSRRIDERIQLSRSQEWRVPGWVPWALGALSSLCSALIVYLVTGAPF
jgi:hypothetical protein